MVSRDWQSLTFPYLYQTVYLNNASHLQQLALRASTTNISEFSVAKSIRELVLDTDAMRDDSQTFSDLITTENVELLLSLLSSTSGLRAFSWKHCFLLDELEVLEVLQTSCLNLRSLTFKTRTVYHIVSVAHYARTFDFKNLSHFSLDVKSLGFDFETRRLRALVLPLYNSPHLQSLELNFEDSRHDGSTWSPNELFAALDGITLSSLRTFRALGSIDPDWYLSFNSDYPTPPSDFFARHSRLETIGLGWMEQHIHKQTFEPRIMETLFPSLLHLEAPDFVCESVMRSTLAGQLQSLNISDLDSPPAGPNLDTISNSSKIMPNLRKLVIGGDRSSPFKSTTLHTLLRCAPGLEELELSWELDEPDEILSALQLVPNL
ncbi:hypothetical protein FRC08_017756, partial [Ceratobasidium sp. 394]